MPRKVNNLANYLTADEGRLIQIISQYRNTWHGHHNVRGQLDVHVGQAVVQAWP